MNLSPLPVQKFFDNAGRPLNGGLLFTYTAGTTTKIATYQDQAGTPNANPIVLNFRGEANVWLDPNLTYKFVLAPSTDTDPPTNPIWTVDNISPLGLTQQIIGKFLWPLTQAEINAGFTDSMISYVGPQGYIPRYKIVANDAASAATNAVALNRLLNPSIANGPTGLIYFPNLGGTDIYYIGDIIQIRDGCRLDLGGSTINFTKTYAASDNTMGFFTFIRDVTIENGSIVVNYNGSAGAGSNPGLMMRIGSRYGYRFAGYANGIFDQDDLVANGLPPMGNIVVRNLRLTSNNPYTAATVAVALIGGLRNVTVENIVFTGNAASGPGCVFYYEFGFASANSLPPTAIGQTGWSSSHGCNLHFRNILARTLNTAVAVNTDNCVVALTEAYSALIENIKGENCYGVVSCRIGEAHFFRPWAAVDTVGAGRCMTIRNIVGQGVTLGTLLSGAQGTTTGYLSDANMIAAGRAPLTPSQKVDLMHFSLDGYSFDAVGGTGILLNGPGTIRNGTTRGSFNGIFIQPECISFELINVECFASTGVGIRASDLSTLFPRNKTGIIRNSKICGSLSAGAGNAGIGFDYTESVVVENCQLGFNAAFDAGNEALQTIGVSVGVNGNGVICRGNYVTTAGGANAYVLTGAGPRGCGVYSPRGTVTYTGIWEGAILNWTAVMTPGTSGSITPVGGQDQGRYTIRDKQVTATLYFGVNTVAAPVGTLTLSGLPFASAAGTNGRSAVTFHGTTLAGTATGLSAQLGASATSFTINTRFAAGAWTSNAADIIANSVVVVSLTYLID